MRFKLNSLHRLKVETRLKALKGRSGSYLQKRHSHFMSYFRNGFSAAAWGRDTDKSEEVCVWVNKKQHKFCRHCRTRLLLSPVELVGFVLLLLSPSRTDVPKKSLFLSLRLPVPALVPATASGSKVFYFSSRRMTARLIFTSPHTNSDFFLNSFFLSFCPLQGLSHPVFWDAEGGEEPPYPYQWLPFSTWCQWERKKKN